MDANEEADSVPGVPGDRQSPGFERAVTPMPDPHDDIIRRLTPGEKLAVAHQLRETAWELAAAGVRLRHPELTEDEVQALVREIFLRVTA